MASSSESSSERAPVTVLDQNEQATLAAEFSGPDLRTTEDCDGPPPDAPLAQAGPVAVPDVAHVGTSVSATLVQVTREACLGDVNSGWDDPDPVQDDWCPGSATSRASERNSASSSPPKYISFDPFTMSLNGLEVELPKNNSSQSHWVSSPFEVLGRTRDPESRDWGLLLRFRDEDGRIHPFIVRGSALHGDLSALCGDLASRGLRVSTTARIRAQLARYLNEVRVNERVTLVSSTGWHQIDGSSVFVLPNDVIGQEPDQPVMLVSAGPSNYASAGSLDEWQAGVGSLIAGHRRLVFLCSVAFAGPLLKLVGLEGGGIHLYGDSSTGKTTAVQVTASVWGKGASPGYVLPWRQTANAFEVTAALHTDTVLAFDEIGVGEAKAISTAVYQLTAGTGKGRLSRDATLKAPPTWTIMMVSTGEMPVAAKIVEERGQRARAGQLVRMIDISADAGAGHGVLDHPGPDNDPGASSDTIKNAAATSYGTAGPAFVRRLVEQGPGDVSGHLRRIIDAFVAANVPEGANGQVSRAAKRFGLIGAAGELAAAWDIVPWPESAALQAAGTAFHDWIADRGGVDSSESAAQIAQIRQFIEEFGESRFDPADMVADTRPVLHRAGWRRDRQGEREWLILPEAWKEICQGFDPRAVARLLADLGMLRADEAGGKLPRTERTPMGPKRVYVVTARILEEEDDES